MTGYTKRDPIVLYYWDALDIVADIFGNPVFANCLEMMPYQLLNLSIPTKEQVYGEFMSGEFAWNYQVRLAKAMYQFQV